MDADDGSAPRFVHEAWHALIAGEPSRPSPRIRFVGADTLPSAFATTDIAVASIGVAGAAMAELIAARGGKRPTVTVDRRLASLWFQWSLQPLGWTLPPPWDPIAGDYRTADGFIRLHTNAAHHRDAALRVLGVAAERAAVTAAVARWRSEPLQDAVVQAGGCAAAMHSLAEWAAHPQGQAVRNEPLIAMVRTSMGAAARSSASPTRARPLAGVRVLDLTRILAGPVATRFLAGYGADVLRIDPPGWEEPVVAPDVTLGKRCARLDLRSRDGVARLRELLGDADVLVHGYRADALERLGLGDAERQRIRPGVIDVALNAYGWTGPWRNRRGFDSLVQMSSGIAEGGQRASGAAVPKPLPVQALDHATGYLMAAAVIEGLVRRARGDGGVIARTSLARTAALLTGRLENTLDAVFAPADEDEWSPAIEASGFGPCRRLRPALDIPGTPMSWDRPATALGSAEPAW